MRNINTVYNNAHKIQHHSLKYPAMDTLQWPHKLKYAYATHCNIKCQRLEFEKKNENEHVITDHRSATTWEIIHQKV